MLELLFWLLVSEPHTADFQLKGTQNFKAGRPFYWKAGSIRKYFLILSWNLPPCFAARWIWPCLLELHKVNPRPCPSFQRFQATAMSVLSLLIWHRWGDTANPLPGGGQRQRPGEFGRLAHTRSYLSSYWVVCPYGILTSMCLAILRLERDEEGAEPERPCEWHDLPN